MDASSQGNQDPPTFGSLLKRYRLAAGLSQEALAERAGVSARAISAYERGLRLAPYRDTVRQLVKALGLSPDETAALERTVQRHRFPSATSQLATHASPPRVRGRTNLPPQLTSFVGREREIAEVRSLLSRTRLLTLTGTGGCGKTRLALEVVDGLAEAYPDGVWLVDLAPLTDPSLLPRAVAAVAGVRDEPGQPLQETLLATLRDRRLLLVFDNCEHLLDACARLAATLLRACPTLQILATSRQALGIAGEVGWQVPSLPVPPRVEGAQEVEAIFSNPSVLDRYAAVELFVERAKGVRPGFTVTSLNALAVAEVCRRLDGIPLAIELAAARARVLSVEQIARRLDDRFSLLTAGSRGAPPRQQTLGATLDWSYGLLSEPEQVLFRRLAVFVGSFNLDAVEAVGEGIVGQTSTSILDLLSDLIDKSLVQVDEEAGEARYRLLETIRQYGREKLFEAEEAKVARRRYRAWCRALVDRAEPELAGPRQSEWLDRLEREHHNLRAVLEDSATDPAEIEEGLRMAGRLLRYWFVRGHLGEGRQLLAPLLDAAQATPILRQTVARMEAVYAAGFEAFWQGDYAAMQSYAEEWLALARDLGDEYGIWLAHDMLARVYMNRGNYPSARAIFVDQLVVMRRLGDAWGIASALVGLGVLERLQGDYERAAAYCEECLAVSRDAGDLWFIGQALSNLGLARYHQGHYGVARKLFGEALALRRDLRDQSGIAWSLINLGDVEQAQGDYGSARARLEESLAILRDLGDRSGRADALASLGRVCRAQQDFAAARAGFVESLQLRRDLAHRLALPAIFEDLAGLASGEGRNTRALVLAGAAAALRAILGAPLSPADMLQIGLWLGPARAALGDRAAEQALAEGDSMSQDQAIAYALEDATI